MATRGSNQRGETIYAVWQIGEVWILSRDVLYRGSTPDEGPMRTDTVDAFESVEEAIDAGQREAAAAGLHLYRMDRHGRHDRLI